MISCKEVSKILSENDNLSLLKKVELRMHLFICKKCSRFEKHLKSLLSGAQKLYRVKDNEYKEKVTHLENSIIKKLKEKNQ